MQTYTHKTTTAFLITAKNRQKNTIRQEDIG